MSEGGRWTPKYNHIAFIFGHNVYHNTIFNVIVELLKLENKEARYSAKCDIIMLKFMGGDAEPLNFILYPSYVDRMFNITLPLFICMNYWIQLTNMKLQGKSQYDKILPF